MRLIGIMPVRDEDWIVGLSARAALMWMDALVVLNHASVDHTAEILAKISAEHPGKVHVIKEDDPVWHEMSHRQMLLEAARAMGATHIATVDADEVLAGDALPAIKDEIRELKPGEVLQMFWAHCWRGIDLYRSDPDWMGKWASMAFRDAPEIHWETRDGYDFHHRHPYDYTGLKQVLRGSALMHLQHAVWRRLLAKQALYKMTERIRWPGRESIAEVDKKYSRTADEAGLKCSAVPVEWWAPYRDIMSGLDLSDSVPWQETECQCAMAEYGREKFEGLDLFGIC